jgi:hypothetical protein
VWRRVNPDVRDRTQNPWVTLQESSQLRLDQVAQDPAFQGEQLARQLGQRGTAPEIVAQAAQVLGPNVLTLGFARRFAAYK